VPTLPLAPFLEECSTRTKAVRSDRQRLQAGPIATAAVSPADSEAPRCRQAEWLRCRRRESTSASAADGLVEFPRSAPIRSQPPAPPRNRNTRQQPPAVPARTNAHAAPKSQPPNLRSWLRLRRKSTRFLSAN